VSISPTFYVYANLTGAWRRTYSLNVEVERIFKLGVMLKLGIILLFLWPKCWWNSPQGKNLLTVDCVNVYKNSMLNLVVVLIGVMPGSKPPSDRSITDELRPKCIRKLIQLILLFTFKPDWLWKFCLNLDTSGSLSCARK